MKSITVWVWVTVKDSISTNRSVVVQSNLYCWSNSWFFRLLLLSSIFAQTQDFKNALDDVKADTKSRSLTEALNNHAEDSLLSVLDSDETFFFDHYLPIMFENLERKFFSIRIWVDYIIMLKHFSAIC